METLYNTIGTGYNATRQADFYLTSRLLHFLQPEPRKQYLDTGCGTGNYTIALANYGLNITGIDPSEKMLYAAREINSKVDWLQGTAENLPFEKGVFSGVVATLTLHHWADLQASFKEISRVTGDNARIVIFTALPEQMQGYWLNDYFPAMMTGSTKQMPDLYKITEALNNAGFKVTITEKYFIKDDLQDHFLYAGKNRPHLYFNEMVRKGISSFAALGNASEVETGLSKLNSHLDNGAFTGVKNKYDNNLGDYLFIVAEKL